MTHMTLLVAQWLIGTFVCVQVAPMHQYDFV